MENGQEINRVDENGTTPLGLAVQNQQIGSVNFCLQHGADANVAAKVTGENAESEDVEWTISPMCLAAQSGQRDILLSLLNSGGEPSARMANGVTPLMAAAIGGNTECVALLIERGANPDERVPLAVEVTGSVRGNPILKAANENHDDVILLLIAEGAAVNVVDGAGSSPIKLAARGSGPKVIGALIAAGADLAVADEQGWSPLMTAAYQERPDIVALLLEAGANPNVQTRDGDDWTPLIAAATYGQTRIAELLLQAGADVSASSTDGRTALDHARDARADGGDEEELSAFDATIVLLKNAAKLVRRL